MKHEVIYDVHQVESQTSIVLVGCLRCKKKAKAYDKHFMRILIDADDCEGVKGGPEDEAKLRAWVSGDSVTFQEVGGKQ